MVNSKHERCLSTTNDSLAYYCFSSSTTFRPRKKNAALFTWYRCSHLVVDFNISRFAFDESMKKMEKKFCLRNISFLSVLLIFGIFFYSFVLTQYSRRECQTQGNQMEKCNLKNAQKPFRNIKETMQNAHFTQYAIFFLSFIHSEPS